ncbi:hypothetical protein GCM10023340_01480 [Nocardioides marinquilinus]|uniref:DUF4446 family protein n=1 Tax=Nocardioides marinquilinus TaxID=1210400 RepID=A0ABP9P595_9ACTN
MPEWVGLAGLVVAVVALLVAVVAVRRTQARADGSDLPADVQGLRREVAALRAENGFGLRHVAVVRYDAFDDMGGHLSWTVALLDEQGDGVLLSSIHGRSDARSYAKAVAGWRCEQQISPEEEAAIAQARP